MKKIDFKIDGDYIELIQLLKAIGMAQTGGHAKMIVDEEMVTRNDELETRKRAKLVKGEVIKVYDHEIHLC
jgi:ribosome-associated protein